MSDLKNVDVMLGSYSRGESGDHQIEVDIEVDLKYIRLQQNTVPTTEVFRSLLNTNSRENSEITTETAR